MSNFFGKLAEFAEKAENVDVSHLADKAFKHARNEIIGEYNFTILTTRLNSCFQGIVNPNREHPLGDIAIWLFSLQPRSPR